MKARYIAVLVISIFLIIGDKSYAHEPTNKAPVAILEAVPEYVMTDVNVALDGSSSYDPDGSITKYEWDWTNDANYDYYETSSYHPDGAFDGITTHAYDSPGTYTAKLKVTDNLLKSGSTTCQVYVNIKISVPDDVNTIQGAIDISTNGSIIIVSPGTYYENINFNPNDITVTSIDPNNSKIVASTIIDGNDCNSVVIFDSGDANSTLKGFTVTDGNAYFGGGIYCYDSSPFISNCNIRLNESIILGGGIYCELASPTFINCLIADNRIVISGNPGGGMFNTNNSYPALTNCVFSGNEAAYGGGMYNNTNCSPTLTNCIFIGCSVGSEGGGMFNDDCAPLLSNCIFANNSANSKGGGMYNYSSSSPTLVNCIFSQNEAGTSGGGLYNSSGSGLNVTNCIFWGNQAGSGNKEIHNEAGVNPIISYCDIEDCNGSGSNWDDSLGTDGGGNIDEDPNFVDASDPNGQDDIFYTIDDGLHLQTYNPCIDAGTNTPTGGLPTTDIDGNPRSMDGDANGTEIADMGAYELPMIWFVDSDAAGGDGKSWGDAFTELRDALNDPNVISDDEIWVADGNYLPTSDSNRAVSFELVAGVGVYGGFAGVETARCQQDWKTNQTILSGDLNGDDEPNLVNRSDNSYHVVIGANDVTLDGFTIKGGNADGSATSEKRGAGIYCDNVIAVISNCLITDNNSAGAGGGMHNRYSSTTITNCFFVDNEGGSGGGIFNDYDEASTLTNCVFAGNKAKLNNMWGGGVCNRYSSPDLLNCTFNKNTAGTGGGLNNRDDSDTKVTNCIFWGNVASVDSNQIAFDGGTASVSYSCVQDYNNDPNQGIVSYWEFDEGSGTVANDSIGDNNGTLYGTPEWVSGQVGSYALEFDGNDDYVDVGNDSSLKSSLPVTITAWIKLSRAGNWQYIVTLDDNYTSYYYGIWFCVRPTNDLSINYGDGMGGASQSYRRSKIGTTALQKYTWHHVAAVVKGPTDMNIYINGKDDGGSYSGSGGSLAYSSANALIGIQHGYGSDFDGTIDDVRIYDQALTAGEIQQLYLKGFIGAGEGNIDSNPLFIDSNNVAGLDGVFGTLDDGLHVQEGSPCIDMADDYSAPWTDIVGLERVDISGVGDANTYADIGAYEADGSDRDGDGLWDYYEVYISGTDPDRSDTDGDELSDSAEFSNFGTDPLSADTDGDKLSDKDEVCYDGDCDNYDPCTPGTWGSDLNADSNDTEGDGLPDGWEVFYDSNALADDASADFDGDGLTNAEEYSAGTNPDGNDTDGDGMDDEWEYDNNLNPLDANDMYANPDNDSNGYVNIFEYEFNMDPQVDDEPPAYIKWVPSNTYATIQSAVDVAVDGNIVVVKPGTYTESGTHVVVIDGNDITLRSINPLDPENVAATIIKSSDPGYDDCINLTDTNSTISGFTLTSGRYGINCSGFSPKINHCVITENSSGGINISTSETITPEIKDCVFSNNTNSGLIIDNGDYSENPEATVENCFFIDNTASYGAGIYVQGWLLKLINCVFTGNESTTSALYYGGGAICSWATGSLVTSIEAYNCTFTDNEAKKGGAIYRHGWCCGGSNAFSAYNCIFWGNKAPEGEETYNENASNVAVAEFSYCDINNNSPNYTYPTNGSMVNEVNCIYWDPLFVYPSNPAGLDNTYCTYDDGLQLEPNSPCVDVADDSNAPATDICGHGRVDIPYVDNNDSNYSDIGAYEVSTIIWHVNETEVGAGDGSTWDDAMFLQDALEQAGQYGGEVWIAAGTHYPDRNSVNPNGSGLRQETFQVSDGIGLYGGFSGDETCRFERNVLDNETILSGDINDVDQADSYHVISSVKGGADTVIDGLTITGGNADGSGSSDSYYGGGLYCWFTSAMINNCTIKSNKAIIGGGAYILNDGFLSPATVKNCTFSSNQADNGGGIGSSESSAGFSGCTFTGNDADLGGGGMNNFTNSSVTVTNCDFSGNTADQGGGICNKGGASPTISNCVFVGNEATNSAGKDGGGMYNDNCKPTVINCTFNANTATGAGAMYNNNLLSGSNTKNCVLWENPGSLEAKGSSLMTFSYCDIRGCGGSDDWYDLTGGDGGDNIDINPNFINPNEPAGPDGIFGTDDDGLRLATFFDPQQIGDTCLDSADGTVAPGTDIIGRARVDIPCIMNSGKGAIDYVDMGAYESPAIWYVDDDGDERGEGCSWDDALDNLSEAIEKAEPGDEIWVAAGKYTPVISQRLSTFLIDKAIAIYGGFAGTEYDRCERNWKKNISILNGNIGDDNKYEDNCFHVVTIDTNDAVLDGLTIADGYANENGYEPNDRGGGIYVDNSSPTIANCIIRDNYAYPYGSGMYVGGGSPTVTDCIFWNNREQKDYYPSYAQKGGGMYNENASPVVTNCIFNRNLASYGAGMYNNNGSSVIVTNCIFRENKAGSQGSAIKSNESSLTATNCIFNANRAYGNGVVESWDSSIMLNNCSLIANERKQGNYNGIVHINGGQDLPRVITNCIFWLNETDESLVFEIYLSGGSTTYALIRNCDIEGGEANIGKPSGGGETYDYENDINSDPKFETAAPEFYDQTTAAGFLDAIVVEDANKYSFCDVIEYNNDGNALTVVYVDHNDNVVVFDPPLGSPTQASKEIKNWGLYAILEHDAGDNYEVPFKINNKIARVDPNISPCIDVGLDTGVPADAPDLDGDGDVLEQIPYDIIDVPRLQDIPSKGGSNSVDMGAFESGGLIAKDILNIVVTEDTNKPIDLNMDDLKGGTPTYVIVVEPEHGRLDPNGTQGVIYVPDENYYASSNADKFYYKAFDSINYSEIAKVTISQITAVDDNAVAVDDSFWINPNDVGDGAIKLDVLANDYDVDGDDPCIYEIVTPPSDGYAVIVDSNEKIQYTPDDPCVPVNDSFTYKIKSTTLYSEPATVTIYANHRPVSVNDITETEPNIIAVIDVLANDTDEDGHSLEIVQLTQPSVGKAKIYTQNEGGPVIVYEPGSGAPYETSLTYKAQDELGIVSASAADVNITVLGTTTISDRDEDKIADSDEGFFGTDANDPDSDDDGFSDGNEIMQDYDPTNPYSGPPYSGTLPYTTCFHPIQGYAINKSVGGQLGWKDPSGTSNIEYMEIFPGNPMAPPFGATVVTISPDSNISKEFDDNGASDDYSDVVWTKFYPVEDANVSVLNGSTILAAAKFVAFHGSGYDDAPEWQYNGTYSIDDIVTYKGCFYQCTTVEDAGSWPPRDNPDCWAVLGSGTIHYLDSGSWTNSGEKWMRWQEYPDYRKYSYGMVLKFVFDFEGAANCTLYWDSDPNEKVNFTNIGQVSVSGFDSISEVKFEADDSTSEVFRVRGIYINDEVEESCRINYPHEGDNIQKSKIPIKGECSMPWMSGYKLIWWTVNYESGWIFHTGGELVNGPNGVLGYWNTGALPKGIYHLEIRTYDDLCYPWLTPRSRTSEGKWYRYDNYDYVQYVGTSGSIASQTFHHVEVPDISVPWPGEFPFELRRIYDSGRQHIRYPFFPGWTNNLQIILTEYADYYESSTCPNTAKAEVADSDASGLAFGAIYVQYENGTTHLFRHTTGSVGSYDPGTGPAGSYEAIYAPYPDDGSGDYVKRTTSGFVPYYYYDDDANALLLKDGDLKVHYELYRRDGTKIAFHDVNEPEVVSIPMGGPYTYLYKANSETTVRWFHYSDEDGWTGSETGPAAAYPRAGFLPFNAAANKSGGAVYKNSYSISGHYFLPANATSFYPYDDEKWRFITAVKTKSDRLGNTLHYEWYEHYYYPFVYRATYKPNDIAGDPNNDGDPNITIEFGWLGGGNLHAARLRTGEEVKKEINYHYGSYWNGYVWIYFYSPTTDCDLLQVSTVDVDTGEEEDFTSYMYWYDSGFLYGIFNDELIPGQFTFEAPWNTRTSLIEYNGMEFARRWDYTETDPCVAQYEFSDDDKYRLRNYWYFFFEPDSGNEEEGQCVLTSWDNYNSDNLTIPYRQDLSIINERGQLRSRIASPIDSLSKLYNYRYEGDYPFTPTKMHEIWLDYDVINDELDVLGKIILDDYTIDKIDFIHPNNPDVNCLDLTTRSVYEMGYYNGDVNKEDPNTLISYGQMDYHDYAGFNLQTKKVSYQTLESKPLDPQNPQNANDVNTLYIYGLHDGNVDPSYDSNNVYLIEKWVLIDDKDTSDKGDDEYAITKYRYNQLTCQADPCHTPPYWNDAYMLTKITDPCGSVTLYTYDANHYKQWVKVGPNDAEVPVERYYYDVIGQLRLKANTYGLVTLNDYDNFGDVIKARNYFDPDALNAAVRTDFTPQYYEDNMTLRSTTVYTYDTQRRRIAEKTFSNEKGPDKAAVKATEYISNSDLISEIRHYKSQSDYDLSYDTGYDSLIEYLYGGIGLKIEEEHTDATGATEVSRKTLYWYDAMDRLVQTDRKDYGGGASLTSTISYYHGTAKKAYDIVKSWYSGSWGYESRADYIYDHLDRLKEEIVSYELDANGLPVQYLTTFYGYDGVGNRTSVTAPDSNVVFTDYDNANRQITEYFAEPCNTDLATTKANAVIRKQTRYYKNDLVRDFNSYDYYGTPPGPGTLLARVEFDYDERGRLIDVNEGITQSGGTVTDWALTTYSYQDTNDSTFTINGKKYTNVTITDPCSETTKIAYTERGDVIKTIYPDGNYAELKYNGDGTVKQRAVWDTSDVKQWVDYYYDSFLRLEDINYPDTGNIHYDYDGFGRNTKIVDSRDANDNIGGSGQITYEYDVLDRVTDVNDQDYYHVEYEYRADNQKESITVKNPSEEIIYEVEYEYDIAGRMLSVIDDSNTIAGFGYDKNGNRSQLTYFLPGPNTVIAYTYNRDNLLTGYNTTGAGPTFTLNNVTVDGLGRLTDANETITNTSQSAVKHSYTFSYDMRSQLTDANISNISPGNWVGEYVYKKNGDMSSRTINSAAETFSYTGNIMTDADGNTLDYDENGNMTEGVDANVVWNWGNKLRSAECDGNTISVKYDPADNRIFKNSSVAGARKYIIDIVGDLPVILMELDTSDNIKKTYIYTNSQIIAQHDGDDNDPNFYLHDRLGSVRQLMDTSGNVSRMYTYEPFGSTLEDEGTLSNPFMFTGQYYDDEIKEYYLRARQYDPAIQRFTSRDPISGQFKEPMTLHVYLYCINDPLNGWDPWGLLFAPDVGGAPDYNWKTTRKIIDLATDIVGLHFVWGPWIAFGRGGQLGRGEFDYKFPWGQWQTFTFALSKNVRVTGGEFGNWLAGYTCYYNYGLAGELGVRGAGHVDALFEYQRLDDPESMYFISAGILAAIDERRAENRTAVGAMYSFVNAKLQLMHIGYDRILGGEFTKTIAREDVTMVAEFGSDLWWDEIIQLQEFWNSATDW